MYVPYCIMTSHLCIISNRTLGITYISSYVRCRKNWFASLLFCALDICIVHNDSFPPTITALLSPFRVTSLSLLSFSTVRWCAAFSSTCFWHQSMWRSLFFSTFGWKFSFSSFLPCHERYLETASWCKSSFLNNSFAYLFKIYSSLTAATRWLIQNIACC